MHEKIWSCKIGGLIPEDVPPGSDWPMRKAIQKACKEITGVEHEFTFSGWDAELTEPERAANEDRLPQTIHKENTYLLRFILTKPGG